MMVMMMVTMMMVPGALDGCLGDSVHSRRVPHALDVMQQVRGRDPARREVMRHELQRLEGAGEVELQRRGLCGPRAQRLQTEQSDA